MKIEKKEGKWTIILEDTENRLSTIDNTRRLIELNEEIEKSKIDNLIVEFDLSKVTSTNSELIAQFVAFQSTLVETDGRVNIINANPVLRSSFDVIMLDKIINIKYQDDEPENEETGNDLFEENEDERFTK